MPTDEGRRRRNEAELYRQTEERKRDESRQRLRGAHLAVQQTVKRRMEQTDQERRDYERRLEKARAEVKKQFGLD